MERYLEKGNTLQRKGGRKYTITEMIGRGSSCAVYKAVDGKTEHLLKEYNPRALSITRTDDGMMCVAEDEQESFSAGLAHFQAGYEKQLDLRQTDELRNSTSNIQDIFDANGTRYIDMTLFTGNTYSNIKEKSLFALCKRMKAVAQVVGNYHKAGLLHLDIKPDNIFAIPETCELVMLFDFDSVVEKNDIQKSAGLSYTKMWAAPEQLVAAYRKRICEATDLYAIGEILFWQIFGRHSTNEEHRSFYEYQFDTESEIFKNTNPKVFPLLSELLHHTITTSVSNRYQSADELIAVLDELIKLSDPKEPYLVSTNVTAEEFFIGRDNELKTIHEMLSEKNILFLCGMGGIGKSELARNFVKRYSSDYDTVFFATYLSSWSMLLTDDYAIQIANFHPYEGEKPEDYYARKLRKLKELCDERTLFVIDNVNEDEYDEQESKCFQDIMGLPCHFLFTSRLHEWSHPMMEVGELAERSDLVALFDKWCPIKNVEQMDAVNDIIDYVDSHTLTLELIAKQTTAGFSTPAKMLSKLKEHGMRDSGKEKVKSDKDLAVSKKTAFEHICDLFDLAELTDDEKYVMANMALIPSTGIESSLFMEWCELENANDIHSLVEKGWIDRDDERIKLHPIVAEVSLNYHYDFNIGDSVMLKRISSYFDKIYFKLPPEKKSRYAKLVSDISNNLVKIGYCTETVAKFLRHNIYVYSQYGYGDLAFACAEKSLDIRLKLFGEKNTKVAASYEGISSLHRANGNYALAEMYLLKALEIRLNIQGENCKAVASLYNSFSLIYRGMKSYDRSRECCDKSLSIYLRLCGEKSSQVATVYNNIGMVCYGQGKMDEAIMFCEKALQSRISLYGENCHSVSISYGCLGKIYKAGKRFVEAEKCFKTALKIQLEIFGESHVEVATSLKYLGDMYNDKDNLGAALQYYEQALSIQKKLLSAAHPKTLETLRRIENVHKNLGGILISQTQ